MALTSLCIRHSASGARGFAQNLPALCWRVALTVLLAAALTAPGCCPRKHGGAATWLAASVLAVLVFAGLGKVMLAYVDGETFLGAPL